MMADSLSPKPVWDGDAKAMQQCLTDIFTSVYTTCDIPENAIFGPCVLSHTSLYDSIAFIALKSTDKRAAPYIFRVDTSAASVSSEGRVWLRLVQSARHREEQNLEAYVKSGQLLYRSLRRIEKDEELLVWYGKDLEGLLLLSSSRTHGKSKGVPPYLCQDCNQHFQFEFPFLAHLRFCCTKGPQTVGGAVGDSKDGRHCGDPTPVRSSPDPARSKGRCGSRDSKPATDFHNLARDLENNRTRPPSNKEAEIRSGNKRKFSQEREDDEEDEEEEENRRRSSSTSPASEEGLECAAQRYREACSPGGNGRSFSPSRPEPAEIKKSAFTEVRKGSAGPKQSSRNPSADAENRAGGRPAERPASARQVLTETQPRSRCEGPGPGGAASAFSSVARHVGGLDGKSAFSQPAHSGPTPPPLAPKLLSAGSCHPAVYHTDPLVAKLHSQDLLQGPKQGPLLYATPYWPKASGAVRMQVPSALALLPPSFTSLCLPAQNWCAKCNASFRMTSDLVYHMRSHHKKEFAAEPLVKRRREEKLRCPICSESFRERHHLSRHMTSHN